MFVEKHAIEEIARDQLVARATKMRADGYRLVQICCVAANAYEVTYTFEKDYRCAHLRVMAALGDAVVPSITGVFLAAFTYENELQDLFGLKVTDLAVDFKGTFYRTAVKTPFAPSATRPAAE